MPTVTFRMDIEIDDAQALWRAARNQAFEQFQSTPFDARSTMRVVYESLRHPITRERDLATCVQWLADPGTSDIPGTSIIETHCE